MDQDPAAALRQQASVLIGTETGNYVLEELLGIGGMGAVYGARHRFLGHRAAVKVLHPAIARTPELIRRFLREASSARTIDHPSVVQILDFGENASGLLYLVMELLRGRNLREELARGQLPFSLTLRIATNIAETLRATHDKGIVHRDLKPENVVLVADDKIKIVDFGCAKLISDPKARLTISGSLLGTPRYMAPELIEGAEKAGPEADVYSLGVMLFEMVTGHPPFDADNWHVLLSLHQSEPPPPVPGHPELEGWIWRCMAKRPGERPPMSELYEGLRRIPAAVPSAPPSAPPSLLAKPARRRPLFPILVLMLVLVGLTSFSALLLKERRTSPTTTVTLPPSSEPQPPVAVGEPDPPVTHPNTPAPTAQAQVAAPRRRTLAIQAPSPKLTLAGPADLGAAAVELARAPAISPAPLRERLDKAAIEATLSPLKRAVESCAEETEAEGIANVTLTIAPSGRTTRVRISGSLARETIQHCIEEVLLAARFPPFTQGPITIQYPFLAR